MITEPWPTPDRWSCSYCNNCYSPSPPFHISFNVIHTHMCLIHRTHEHKHTNHSPNDKATEIKRIRSAQLSRSTNNESIHQKKLYRNRRNRVVILIQSHWEISTETFTTVEFNFRLIRFRNALLVERNTYLWFDFDDFFIDTRMNDFLWHFVINLSLAIKK